MVILSFDKDNEMHNELIKAYKSKKIIDYNCSFFQLCSII